MLKDLAFSLRQLRKTPVFTASSILVLAAGIGLNAAAFGLSYAIVFSDRPFEKPAELVQLYSRQADEPDSYRAFSHAAFRQIASSPGVFSGVLAHQTFVVGVNERADAAEPRRAMAEVVSASYFKVLGVQPALGRGFSEDEDRPDSDIPVAIASHALWKRTGFDKNLLGGTIRINQRPFTIVGITPQGFMGTSTMLGPEVYLPLGVFDALGKGGDPKRSRGLQTPDNFPLLLVARLQHGTTPLAAEEKLKVVSAAIERVFPVEYRRQEFSVRALPRFVTSAVPASEGALSLLSISVLGMTGSVLLIVCLNLASMFLARGQDRRREFAIRLAMGAPRKRIVRQLLIEGLAISIVGGGLGIAFGRLALDALTGALLERLPMSLAVDLALTPAIFLGAAALSIVATLMFALLPALRHTGNSVLADLKQQAGDNQAGRRFSFMPRHPILALQVALSLSLLIAAGLFLQMTRQATVVNPEFKTGNTVVIEADAGLAGYPEAQGLNAFSDIETRLRSIPGATGASIAANLPFSTLGFGEMVRRAGTGASPDRKSVPAQWNAIGASYFDTLGLALKRGRAFTDAETRQKGSPRVGIIDEGLARELWPQGDPIGQSVEFEPRNALEPPSPPIEIVGIIGAISDDAFDKTPGRAVYVPFAQGYKGRAYFAVRGQGLASEVFAGTVEREVRAAVPGLATFRAITFERHVSSSLGFWGLRLTSSLLLALGGAAALVTLLGIYGTFSHTVVKRTREFGIRLAIGATPGAVRGMVISEALAVAGSGVALGLLFGLGVGKVMDSIFVDVGAFDAATFLLAPLLLLVASAAAAWLPARRATTVNPVTALRAD
jgi:predicted permease